MKKIIFTMVGLFLFNGVVVADVLKERAMGGLEYVLKEPLAAVSTNPAFAVYLSQLSFVNIIDLSLDSDISKYENDNDFFSRIQTRDIANTNFYFSESPAFYLLFHKVT